MRALDRKLMRDLWRLKGQVLAVALVIASGTALLVMSLSAVTSLSVTTQAYYDRYRFADVFAGVKRAPERLAGRIADIPGVRTVQTRVTAFSTLDVAGTQEPITAVLVSLPERGEALLNRPAVRAGRLPAPGRTDEAVVLAPFAEAHGLMPGDSISVLLNGVRREVRLVGIALSPEYVYAIGPGALMPDDRRFAVLWMGRDALAAAYDLEGAFNDVALGLLPGADPGAVIARLDPLLERYGGTGAIARKDQISNWFLTNELAQIRTMAVILPSVFLSVAAFLTYTVLGRLIATERREISLLKAFGYSNVEVAVHYAKLALAMAAVGVLLGWVLGAGLGRWNTENYSNFFRFPFLYYRPSGIEFLLSAAIGLGVALIGALGAVRRAAALPPAEAMRPPAPEMFRAAAVPVALARRLDTPTRIILRQLTRTPGRALITVSGVALAVGVLVTAFQWSESITSMARTVFEESQHQDMVIAFHEERPKRALHALAHLPGVLAAEPMRIVAARLHAGPFVHRGAVTGLPAGARMQPIRDVRGWTVPVPAGGIVLGTVLAEKLHVGPGDTVEVEVLGGTKRRFPVPVVGTFETLIETPAYMGLERLNRELRDPPVFRVASLLVDPAEEARLYAAVRGMPGVSALMVKQRAIESMLETMGETILIFISFFTLFAGSLAYGVVYNALRIALSERGRELATLRVLGFTRWEISYILIGEAALLVLAAVPLGWLAGWGLSALIAESMATELYRVPLALTPAACGKAALVILAASILSAAIVRSRLDRLDLIAVLKTRE